MTQLDPNKEYEPQDPKCAVCGLPVVNMSKLNRIFTHIYCMFGKRKNKKKKK